MKKLLIAFILITCAVLSKAQIAKHAIGLRLGGGGGFNTEISYQHGLSDLNRLEFDLGTANARDHTVWGLSGLYQWVWNIDDGFNWYAGAGGIIGSWNWGTGYGDDGGGMFLAAAGDIGVEYVFPIGIQLSLDLRPTINLVNSGDLYNNSIAFGIRYQF